MTTSLLLALLVVAEAVALAVAPLAVGAAPRLVASGPPPTRSRPQPPSKPASQAAPPPAPPPSEQPLAGKPAPPAASAATAPASPLATRAAACRPSKAQRCSVDGCQAADEGLHAEFFELDVAAGTVGGCLYTDCYTGPARVVRDRAAPWLVTAFGEVRSERPADAVPPPGSDPFPLTVSVDLRTGRFTAIWSLSPAGLQVDFGDCELRGPE